MKLTTLGQGFSLWLVATLLGPPASGQPLAEGIEIGGRVLADAEVPVEGARVLLLRHEDEATVGARLLEGTEPEVLVRTATDGLGLFRLAAPGPGGYLVRVEAEGRLAARFYLSPLVEDVELPALRLERRREVVLEVRDGQGEPVAGAGVEAETAEDSPLPYFGPDATWWPAPRRGQTDEAGRIRLAALPDERLAVRVVRAGFEPLEREVGESLRLELRELGAARTLEVRDRFGRGVEGVLVRPAGAVWPLGRTDEEGRIRIGVGEEERALELLAPDGGWGRTTLEGAPVGSSGRPVVVRLEPPPEVVARVVDATSKEVLPGAWVGYERRPGGRKIAQGMVFFGEIEAVLEETGAQGTVSVTVSPVGERRSLFLRVALPGYVPGRYSMPAEGEVEVALAPAAAAAGVVVDEAGEPLRGVEITARQKTIPTMDWSTREAWRSLARSRRDGSFRLLRLLPGSLYGLEARAEGFAPAKLELSALEPFSTTGDLRIVLVGGLDVTGLVLTEEELPVPAASVYLYDGPDQTSRRVARSGEPLVATTDGDGRFRFENLAAGRRELVVTAAGFALAVVPGVEIPHGSGDLELGTVYLSPEAVIRGVVVDPDGKGLAEAQIQLMVSLGLARPGFDRRGMLAMGNSLLTLQDLGIVTDEEGRFVVAGLQAGEKVGLVVSREGYLGEELQDVEAPTEEPLEIVLERGASVAGRVLGEGRAPVPGARVRILAGGDPPFSWTRDYLQAVTTDEEGRFRIDGIPAGTWGVSAMSPEYAQAKREGLLLEGGKAIENLELVLGRGVTVEGRVLDADGAGIGQVQVSTGTSFATSGSDGGFRLPNVPLGKATVRAMAPDRSSMTKEIEVWPAGAWVELRFAGLALGGRVVDGNGEGLPGARLMLMEWPWTGQSRLQHQAASDADGAFRFDRLPAGGYRVTVSLAGYADAGGEETITLVDAPRLDLEIVLEQGVLLTGRVVGLTPDELAQVMVWAYGERSRAGPAPVDYEGRFQLENVPPGTYTVTASLQSRSLQASEEVVVDPSGGWVELELGGGFELSGVLVHNGEPMSGARISLEGDRTAHRSVFADPSGRFLFSGLQADRFLLSAYAELSLVGTREVVLEADEEILFEVSTATVRGAVVDGGTGEPVEGAVLTLRPLPDSTSQREPRFRGLPQREARSSAEGRFLFEEVAEGTVVLLASHDDYAAAERRLEVRGGAVLGNVVVALQREEEGLELRVRGPAGVPERVEVGILSAAGGLLAVRTYDVDPDGSVVAKDVPPGSFILVLSAPASATREVAVEVPGPEVPVTLPVGNTLTIHAPSLEGESATLQLVGADGRPFRRLLQGELRDRFPLYRGRAEVTGLPAGTWEVRVETADGRVLTGTVATPSAGSVVVE